MTIINKLHIRWSKCSRKVLQAFFKFDRWHVSPFISRAYAKAIVDFLNSVDKKNNIAEIGCGLADILRNVNFKNKFGFDADVRVLKAAKFLSFFGRSGATYHFKKFVFPSALEGNYDVILLVNWIHHIEPFILKSYLGQYFKSNLAQSGFIIIDTVADKAYKYNHDIEFLTEQINCSLICIGNYENNREVWAIKKS